MIQSRCSNKAASNGIRERAISQIEKTDLETIETDARIPPESRQSLTAEIDVPTKIRMAIEKHRRDLPELMKRHEYQWAAYRGGERLEIGKSKRSLYRKYIDRGLSLDEIVVLGIGPEIPDEIDGEVLDIAVLS